MTVWYLASPYTKYRRGPRVAFYDAAEAAGKLTAAGLVVYSPIAHSHPIATFGDLDALDGAFWERVNRPMMRALHGLIVLHLEGWEDSAGVAVEIAEFGRMRKPVIQAPIPLDVTAVVRDASLHFPVDTASPSIAADGRAW